ncbi:hypothetical protein [Modestobacter marinus]|uniref:hypothetical protein n=1 Tax=Modestobacter marinus TaxID=477641 RepID=UPI001C960CAD|nr:hypothetical protein [Modestobacter marinus]
MTRPSVAMYSTAASSTRTVPESTSSASAGAIAAFSAWPGNASAIHSTGPVIG